MKYEIREGHRALRSIDDKDGYNGDKVDLYVEDEDQDRKQS